MGLRLKGVGVRSVLAMGAITAAIAVAAPTAGAANAFWAAQWVAQSQYLTLESDEVGASWLQARNIGSMTWYDSFVLLGTSYPRDRQSQFRTPDWPSANRAARLTPASVPPGATATFNFTVKAPAVTATTVYREPFEPVADTTGGDWMGDNPPMGGRPWPLVFLEYTVVPAEPPSVRFTTAPSAVAANQAFSVAATATDNRAVDRVVFAVGPRTVVVPAANAGPNTFGATLDTTALQTGVQTVFATAYDRAGHSATTTASFYISADPVAPNGDRVIPLPLPRPTPRAGYLPWFVPYGRFTVVPGTTQARLRGFEVGSVKGGSTVRVQCLRNCASRFDRRYFIRRTIAALRSVPLLPAITTQLRNRPVIRMSVTRPGWIGRYADFLIVVSVNKIDRRPVRTGCVFPRGRLQRCA
jgi:hypothetical protein